MRRRPSASTTDDEEEDAAPTAAPAAAPAKRATEASNAGTPPARSLRHQRAADDRHQRVATPSAAIAGAGAGAGASAAPPITTTRLAKSDAKSKRKNSRPSTTDSAATAWKTGPSKTPTPASGNETLGLPAQDLTGDAAAANDMDTMAGRSRIRNPWAVSWPALATLISSIALLACLWQSFITRQLDPKGGSMSYMASSFVNFNDFDTEHTRFATKYSLHMYRELGVDEDPRVSCASPMLA
jgi:glycosylphosphatidylinositol deacylase